MKLLKISIVRAIAALVVGVLLIKYDEAVLKGLTIALGVMFLIAGVVSLAGWVLQRGKKPSLQVYDNGQAQEVESAQAVFPIAGLGSLLLGFILSLTRSEEYLEWAMYLLGAVLVLGALNQVMNIVAARKMEPIGAWMWLAPIAIAVAAVVAMLKGLVPPETTTTILGATAIVYAVVEVVYSILFSNVKHRFEKTQAQVRRANEVMAEASDAELVPTSE